jgi:outer membrane protein assembly factor BamB
VLGFVLGLNSAVSSIRNLFRLSVLLLISAAGFAQGTRTWEQSKFDEFERGTAKGIAIRSDGFLELAPAFRSLATTQSTFLWSVASDDRGNVFAAAGAPSRVYRITPDGKVSIVLAPGELQVQALVADKSGAIYAATSPDGKLYRIAPKATAAANQAPQSPATTSESLLETHSPDNHPQVALDAEYSSSVYFEPKTKYIWALALDADGRLYVATGDRGEIFRVNRDGTSSLFFKSDEAHIRCIAFDPHGNLIAGSDGSGLVYRITPSGEAFVLYSAPKKEITALAIDSEGNIFAAAAGDKRPTSIPSASFTPPAAGPATVSIPTGGQAVPNPPQSQVPVPGLGATGSEVYRIAPDGSPKRLWSSHDDLVYSLALDQNGHLLAGTGNKGKIYVIGVEGDFTDLLKASANQVIGFARASKGLYAATSNLGKIFVIENTPVSEGTFESDVFDAHNFSRWGRAEVRSRGNVELFARSGNVDNPDRNWSNWKKVNLQKDPSLEVPAARYVQWRAVLHAGNPASPQVDSVTINYLPKNVAPEVDEVQVLVGSRYPTVPKTSAEVLNAQSSGASAPPAIRDRDYVSVNWRAHDENDDQLSYSIYYRGDNETRWKLLKEGLGDRFYSFESSLLPDGGYSIKIVATDAPSQSPDQALTGSRESARFEVDSTPPVVANLAATEEGGALHVTFTAIDSFSAIRRAEYSIDAGEWQFVAPVGGISDARVENYDLTVPLPRSTDTTTTQPELRSRSKKQAPAKTGEEEHVIVVRVYDRFDNMGSAKVVVRPITFKK